MSKVKIRVNSATPMLSPTKTSELINDSDFQNGEQVAAAVAQESTVRGEADTALDAKVYKAFVHRTALENPAAFDDGADDMPIKELVAEIDYQPGGQTSCTINRAKKNLLPVNEVSFTGVTDDYISVPPIPAGTYTFSALVTSSDTDDTKSLIRFLDINQNALASVALIRDERASATVVLPDALAYIQFFASGERSTSAGDTATFSDIQLELGSAATDYESYNGQEYTVDWLEEVGTVYGGTLNITTGELMSTLDENGDPLTEPMTYQLAPAEITTLLGDNRIWADTGDVTVIYRADPTIEAEGKVDKADYDPVEATESMTQPVGKDANGRLFTAPSSGGGSSVNPVVKTPDMIYPVGVDGSGKLWASYAPDNLSWSRVQSIVRSGFAPIVFPVGYEFTTIKKLDGTQIPITWVVRGHDHHKAADPTLTHTMTLETKYVYSGSNGVYKGLVFDAAEALYYCEEALPAGTYHFVWTYASFRVEAGTFQFTITQGVPAGGQIVINVGGNSSVLTNRTIATYASVGATTAIESGLVITAGSGGTSLGTVNATTSTDDNLNCGHRIIFGSDNYAQSAARQWLNSSANLGNVWTPTSKFDRAPEWHNSSDTAYRGFMYGLDDDFLSVVQTAKIACRTNSVFEVDSLDGTGFSANQVYELEDKFFLLSRPEIYGTYDNTSYQDGTQLKYYEGLTQTELIKRDTAGSACRSWLRSANPIYANTARVVYTSGDVDYAQATVACTVAPACIIA
ncbi:MAG: hypothetical protein J5482_02230 [Oscillospiraceae bacterium]|nr:hypothetical protein [Oscillospiraceae bacterium]